MSVFLGYVFIFVHPPFGSVYFCTMNDCFCTCVDLYSC